MYFLFAKKNFIKTRIFSDIIDMMECRIGYAIYKMEEY